MTTLFQPCKTFQTILAVVLSVWGVLAIMAVYHTVRILQVLSLTPVTQPI